MNFDKVYLSYEKYALLKEKIKANNKKLIQ